MPKNYSCNTVREALIILVDNLPMCSPLARLNIIFNLGNPNIALKMREREREVLKEEEKIEWWDC